VCCAKHVILAWDFCDMRVPVLYIINTAKHTIVNTAKHYMCVSMGFLWHACTCVVLWDNRLTRDCSLNQSACWQWSCCFNMHILCYIMCTAPTHGDHNANESYIQAVLTQLHTELGSLGILIGIVHFFRPFFRAKLLSTQQSIPLSTQKNISLIRIVANKTHSVSSL